MTKEKEKKVLRIDDIEGDFLTKEEVASILRTSVRTIERNIESGLLIAVELGERSTVVNKKDFLEFIEKKKTGKKLN